MLDRLSRPACVVLASIAGALWPGPAASQTPELQIPRERVLVVDMRIEPTPLLAVPASAGAAGVAWTRDVSPRQPVSGMRLRIDIAAGATADWELRILQLDGTEIERLTGQPSNLSRVVWSDEIPATSARLEMVRGAKGGAPAVAVKEYAYRIMPTVEQAIYGKDQRLAVRLAPMRVRRHSPAVARLRFIIPGQGQATCTGFMVGVRLMMTNEHCISNKEEALTAIADFNYDSSASNPTRVRVEALVSGNAALDYALLKLAAPGPPSTGRLFFNPAPAPPGKRPAAAGGDTLFIIQHPSGLPKEVSIADCAVSGTRLVGVQPASQTDFGHTCDTLGGSSGSPVLSWNSGRIVGLHHFGFHQGVPDPVNQAVDVDGILSHIAKEAAEEFKEVSAVP